MRRIATIYFFLSGILLSWKGAAVVVSGVHLGPDIQSWFVTESMQTRRDAHSENEQARAAAYKQIAGRLSRATGEGFEAGLILCAIGALHILFSLITYIIGGAEEARVRPPNPAPGLTSGLSPGPGSAWTLDKER